jgi:hypothetical protein
LVNLHFGRKLSKHKAYLLDVKRVTRYILKKSKASKKSTKSVKPKKMAPAAKSPKAPTKMPVDTFDAWVAKQVRAERKGGALEASAKVEGPVPKDTFDSWIDKQKPKESAQEKSTLTVPDTYDKWMDKQVAQRSADEEKQEQAPAEPPAPAAA